MRKNAIPNNARAFAPGPVKLRSLSLIAALTGKYRGHPFAILRAEPRCRDQILHRCLRRDLPFSHLLLDPFRQQFHQRQPPRYPAHAPVETAGQFLHRVAEALRHRRQQPALFKRAFLPAEAQRSIQQQRFGFAHLPHSGFHRVPAQLLQCGDALVAIDHYVAAAVACGSHNDDRGLLSAFSQ